MAKQILNIDKIDIFAGELHIYSSYSDDILLHLYYYIIINDYLKKEVFYTSFLY